MSRWRRLQCRSAIIHFIFNFSEIKIKEREIEKESERKKSKIPWRRVWGSTERRTSSIGAEAERSTFSDLRSAMRGDQANDDDDDELAAAMTAAMWPSVGKWFTGFYFGLCIGDFFFLINTSVLCVWFAEFCVWFAFVLGFCHTTNPKGFEAWERHLKYL